MLKKYNISISAFPGNCKSGFKTFNRNAVQSGRAVVNDMNIYNIFRGSPSAPLKKDPEKGFEAAHSVMAVCYFSGLNLRKA